MKAFWGLIVVMIALVALLFVSFVDTKEKYFEACSQTGGKTIFDGRQYQCMK